MVLSEVNESDSSPYKCVLQQETLLPLGSGVLRCKRVKKDE